MTDTDPLVTPGPHDDVSRDVMRWLGMLVAVAVISAAHYATMPEHFVLHSVYQRCYYVPVILAAYWYGVRGGVLAAAVSALAYIPHIHTTWAYNAPYTVSQYAELVVFIGLGCLVGSISSYQRRLTNRYRDTAESLERANRELRESSEQLRRAERLSALGEIAAGLAHEIRNPLAGMKGALEIVTARAAVGTPEAEFSAIATRELGRLEGLVQEFLDYARPRTPQLRPIDVAAVVAHVVSLLGPESERAGVRLIAEGDDAAPGLRGDSEQIEQVLVNLTLNAIQASPRDAEVQLRHHAVDRDYVFQVIDQGGGIDEKVRARIFEPFFTTKEHGTGLGLAISQRIVAAHHGDIRIASEPGKGTTIDIRLPLSAAAQARS